MLTPRLLTFVETSAFTRRLAALGLEDELRTIQFYLLEHPHGGTLDPRTGGLRKLRVAARGKGKRGGARIHYLYLPARGSIYLMYVYGKDEQEALTALQKEQLRALVEEIKGA